MPRPGWRKPETSSRLTDAISVGVLTRVFPPDLVDEVIAECGRTEQRTRALPARTMAYFSMGMALHNDGSYDDVLALISDGLAWADREGSPTRLANKAAITHARNRLGPEPLKALYDRVSRPLATADTPGAFLAGRRIVAIDGTTLDVPDTGANDAYFGRPGHAKGEKSAFPQARLVAIAECSTHALIDAVLTPYTTSENRAASELLTRLEPGMICFADRGFYSFTAWQTMIQAGADGCWRVKNNLRLEPEEILADGSWLANVYDSKSDKRRGHPVRVRVIEYTIDDGREHGSYRLLTSILDPDEASAVDLACAYAGRWEIETVFDELKTHQRGARHVLRSGSPGLVAQEVWGHLCTHYAIRALMAGAARAHDTTPDRVSFVAALRISRRSIAQQGSFSPSVQPGSAVVPVVGVRHH